MKDYSYSTSNLVYIAAHFERKILNEKHAGMAPNSAYLLADDHLSIL